MFNFAEKTDSQLQQDVMKELNWDPSVNSTRVDVTARTGIVTWTGKAPSVMKFVNDLEVSP